MNPITEIAPEISNLQNLEYLYLDETNLTQLPSEISKCAKLKVLALSKTQITELPSEIDELMQLEMILFLDSKLSREQKMNMKRNLPNVEIVFE